jgi:hypothetical protein
MDSFQRIAGLPAKTTLSNMVSRRHFSSEGFRVAAVWQGTRRVEGASIDRE